MSERYSRQILFPGIGKDGQQKLADGRVLILGCGALGAAHAESMVRAGTGFVRLVDRDFVEYSNLQRQSLYTEEDAHDRTPKAIAARNRLTQINSAIEIDAIVADVNQTNIEEFVADVDLVLDGTDNFQIRYLLNDASVKTGKPWVYGAAVSSYGTTMTIIPGETPCLRCIFEEIPAAGSAPTCDTAGVIQPIISAVSSVQVTEAFKILTGKTDELHRSLLQIDIWRSDWRKIKASKPNIDCPCCGAEKFEFLNASEQDFLTSLCGRNAVQVRPQNAAQIDLEALARRLSSFGEFKVNEYLLRFVVEDYEITVFKDARAIIKGTDDNAAARSVYSKYVGN
ncbi:MAG: ThiF family adenylyltransferase [Acidobacteriota bacterium]|nr:ThiF family adenylyltransferase [Acidobacteriota bacterium]MDH3528837.1 ThiF family adenylyltransferase [Acidobacteriota bacterium]